MDLSAANTIPPQTGPAASLFAEDKDRHGNCLAWSGTKAKASRTSCDGGSEFLNLDETPSGCCFLINDLLQARSEILAGTSI
jgi:hypothetical protein